MFAKKLQNDFICKVSEFYKNFISRKVLVSQVIEENSDLVFSTKVIDTRKSFQSKSLKATAPHKAVCGWHFKRYKPLENRYFHYIQISYWSFLSSFSSCFRPSNIAGIKSKVLE